MDDPNFAAPENISAHFGGGGAPEKFLRGFTEHFMGGASCQRGAALRAFRASER